jgi:transposase InsO family protein
MTPAMIEMLLDVHRRASAAPRGGKSAVYDEAARRLCISVATLHRKLKEVTMKPERKRRSDAGKLTLPLTEAQIISAFMMEAYRANDKRLGSVEHALEVLRKNGQVLAGRVDPETGEYAPLSVSAVTRALRAYALHPEQLRRPSPAREQGSDHPNDVWMIDASISTLFYVPEGGVADMSPAEFYKNKPANFEKIKRQRLTRYVITDHTSGAIFVHYVAGGESIVNLTESFLACVAQRPQQQMYGVPFHLVIDPGSGDTGAFRNLMRRLQVELVVNAVGNPRAKGQVENAHNLVETNFEVGFKFAHVPDIGWINAQAARWMRWYNSTRIHSRTGMTRYAKWMEITASQLRTVDSDLARELLTHEPVTRKVSDFLRVEFAGREWDVSAVPNVMVGEKLSVTHNPFRRDVALVVDTDADGQERLTEIPEVVAGQHGFSAGAAKIGREYKAHADTVADRNRKLVERIATGADTDAAAADARKAKALPFGGAIDPYRHLDDVPDVIPLPRRGTELTPATATASAVPALVLTHFQAAQALLRAGLALNAETHARIAEWYPDGVPDGEIDALKHRLTVRGGLRVVGS